MGRHEQTKEEIIDEASELIKRKIDTLPVKEAGRVSRLVRHILLELARRRDMDALERKESIPSKLKAIS